MWGGTSPSPGFPKPTAAAALLLQEPAATRPRRRLPQNIRDESLPRRWLGGGLAWETQVVTPWKSEEPWVSRELSTASQRRWREFDRGPGRALARPVAVVTTPSGIGGISSTGSSTAYRATIEASVALMSPFPEMSPTIIGSISRNSAKPTSNDAATRATCDASLALIPPFPDTSPKEMQPRADRHCRFAGS